MAGFATFIPQGGAVPEAVDPGIFAEPSNVSNYHSAIPTNVAVIVLLSAGVLVGLKMLRFNFVIGLGSN